MGVTVPATATVHDPFRPIEAIAKSLAKAFHTSPTHTLVGAAADIFSVLSIPNPHTFFHSNTFDIGNSLKAIVLDGSSGPPALSMLAMGWLRGYSEYRRGQPIPESIVFYAILRLACIHFVIARLNDLASLYESHSASRAKPLPATTVA